MCAFKEIKGNISVTNNIPLTSHGVAYSLEFSVPGKQDIGDPILAQKILAAWNSLKIFERDVSNAILLIWIVIGFKL